MAQPCIFKVYLWHKTAFSKIVIFLVKLFFLALLLSFYLLVFCWKQISIAALVYVLQGFKYLDTEFALAYAHLLLVYVNFT